MEALQSNEFKKLIDSNPQIKSVMQDGGNIQKAQNLLKDPEVAQTISKIMTNPDTLQKAGAMLEGLKQVDTQVQGQLGGGRRRRRKSRRKSRKRRKSTKKSRRKKRGGLFGKGCIGIICKLVKKAVEGKPKDLLEYLEDILTNKGIDGFVYGFNSPSAKVKREFDYYARRTRKNPIKNKQAAFAEWWVFDYLKHNDNIKESDKDQLTYAKQGQWYTDFTMASPIDANSRVFNSEGIKNWWKFDENPISPQTLARKKELDINMEYPQVTKKAPEGGRRRKSRRKKRRKSKKRKSRRRKRRKRRN